MYQVQETVFGMENLPVLHFSPSTYSRGVSENVTNIGLVEFGRQEP